MVIQKFENNLKQWAHSTTYNFRNDFERLSCRFELFSDCIASFSHLFLCRFRIVIVVIATLFSASSWIDKKKTKLRNRKDR